MTQLKQIIETEQQRTTIEQARMLAMYPEGSFYRAYEWSAWLWCRHVKDFQPTHRKVKSLDNTIIHIGCPVSSFIKHLPDEFTHTISTEGVVNVTLTATAIPDDADLSAMQADFEQWKQSYPVVESKKQPAADAATAPLQQAPTTITAVMQQILSFPIEKKSMIECVSFLSDVKTRLAQII